MTTGRINQVASIGTANQPEGPALRAGPESCTLARVPKGAWTGNHSANGWVMFFSRWVFRPTGGSPGPCAVRRWDSAFNASPLFRFSRSNHRFQGLVQNPPLGVSCQPCEGAPWRKTSSAGERVPRGPPSACFHRFRGAAEPMPCILAHFNGSQSVIAQARMSAVRFLGTRGAGWDLTLRGPKETAALFLQGRPSSVREVRLGWPDTGLAGPYHTIPATLFCHSW
jgi:hypothetical protein